MAETQRGLSAGMGQEEVALSGDPGRWEEGWGPVHWVSSQAALLPQPRSPAPGQAAGRAPGRTDAWSASRASYSPVWTHLPAHLEDVCLQFSYPPNDRQGVFSKVFSQSQNPWHRITEAAAWVLKPSDVPWSWRAQRVAHAGSVGTEGAVLTLLTSEHQVHDVSRRASWQPWGWSFW